MPLPVYVVASNMIGQQTRIDMIADNVANANTGGYKKQGMDFAEILSKQQSMEVASFNQNLGTYTDHAQGGLKRTNNDLDVALQDEKSFFAVQGENGKPLYTRNGHFTKNANGDIVDSKGRAVLDSNGAAITIPADSAFIHITGNGAVANQNGIISNIGVFTFDNEQLLQRAGNNSWYAPDALVAISEEMPNVKQGFVEDSNVNPIEETVHMTDLMRKYQMAAKLMGNMEELETKAIQTLSSMP